MKKINLKLSVFLIAIITVSSCASSDNAPSNTAPSVSTSTISSVTLNSASSGGNVTSDGGDPVTARGIVWNTATSPTTSLTTKTNDGTGTGNFSSSITSLIPSSTYFVRAYATNSIGTAYGNELSFTSGAIVLPTVSTTAITNITTNSSVSGGTITADGGGNITARGIVWSTSQNPTIALTTKTTDGTGLGSFVSNMITLAQNTTYYVKAYATNSAGTAYGNELSFTTGAIVLPTLSTTGLTSITSNSSISGGSITADGGRTITARGIVWSTSQNPTIALTTKTSNGTGLGNFVSNMVYLTQNTTYYVKAYATNSAGTAYGNQLTFTTTNSIVLTDITICNQVWKATNLDVTTYRDGTIIPQVTDESAWANLTTGAWCYYNNDSAIGGTCGKIYNWYAVAGIYDAASLTNTSLRKQLAPNDYHIPTKAEWTTLTNCLGGVNIAGGKMKEEGTLYWLSPNTSATNSNHFTGLPGGGRSPQGGFGFIGIMSQFVNSTLDTTYGSGDLFSLDLSYNRSSAVFVTQTDLNIGNYVRCIKD